MIRVDITIQGITICISYRAKSSIRPEGDYSFFIGDEISVSHPNVKNLKHRNKSGIIQDRLTRNGEVYIKFFDGSFGSVSPLALIPFVSAFS